MQAQIDTRGARAVNNTGTVLGHYIKAAQFISITRKQQRNMTQNKFRRNVILQNKKERENICLCLERYENNPKPAQDETINTSVHLPVET